MNPSTLLTYINPTLKSNQPYYQSIGTNSLPRQFTGLYPPQPYNRTIQYNQIQHTYNHAIVVEIVVHIIR